MANTHYYISASYKSKWSFWDGDKFVKNLAGAKQYLERETTRKVAASLQKLSPSLVLKIEEVVTPT